MAGWQRVENRIGSSDRAQQSGPERNSRLMPCGSLIVNQGLCNGRAVVRCRLVVGIQDDVYHKVYKLIGREEATRVERALGHLFEDSVALSGYVH